MPSNEGGPDGKIRIVLCDENERRRTGTRFWLSGVPDFSIVAEVDRVDETARQLVATPASVVVIERAGGQIVDLAELQFIRQVSPDTRFVVLGDPMAWGRATAKTESTSVLFVPEQLVVDDLVSAVRQAASPAGRVHGEPPDQRDAPRDKVATLTPREWQLWAAVLSGKRNREIASDLELSIKTVENQLTRLFGKLEVASRTALFRWTIDEGMEEEVIRRGGPQRGAG